MTDFSFAAPHYLHLVWVVIAITIAVGTIQLRTSTRLSRFMSDRMQQRLVRGVSPGRRLLAVTAFSTTLLLIVVALMRPQWGAQTIQADSVSSQVMICLDVSKSMLAEDVVPNRLNRAITEIDALLGLMRDGQQVGLIAFAGKATVLCPQTTDFGFLRLILRETSPASVGLGGTKIGDAIRAATEGFGAEGDVNRVMLVITDGEDHDSFPVEAAQAAAEKGIRIVTVGFGDESGSRIEITDTKTGNRSYLLDREGDAVVSRLDGATLREIALTTQGAYIPAGTGALDLQSIYDAHIKTLLSGVKGDSVISIRNEAFQWPLAASLLSFLISVRLAAPKRIPQTNFSANARAAATLLIAIGISTVPTVLHAQDTPAMNSSGKDADAASSDNTLDGEIEEQASEPIILTARETYNLAILRLADTDEAEQLLNDARSRAGVDGEVRFRSLYNLGWIETRRAEELEEAEPEEALKHLNLAAGRLREAIRIRPESQDARRNLEVVSLRMLAIQDRLNQQDPSDLPARLDRIIEEATSLGSELMTLSQSQAQFPDDKDRQTFRQLGGRQRMLIADVAKLNEDTLREIDRLQEQSKGETTPQEDPAIQAAKLAAMANYVERSLPWHNKSRSFSRRLSAQPAFLRWNTGTNTLKRAREQLNDPVQRLAILMADVRQHAQLTDVKASSSLIAIASEVPTDKQASQAQSTGPQQAPAWLDKDYLVDSQRLLTDRAEELHRLFTAISESAASDDTTNSAPRDNSSSEANSQTQAREEQAIKQKFRLAAVPLERAAIALENSGQRLTDQAFHEATPLQYDALEDLAQAAEYFYDVKRLIEAALADQEMIGNQLERLRGLTLKNAATEANVEVTPDAPSPAESQVAQPIVGENEAQDIPARVVEEIVEALLSAQEKNSSRMTRLKQEIDIEADREDAAEEAESLSDNPTNAATATEQPANSPAQERAMLAQELCDTIIREMQTVAETMATPDGPPVEQPEVALDDTQDQTDPVDKARQEEAPDKGEPQSNADSTQQQNRFDGRVFDGPVQHSKLATESLEELRRLYFSLVEHLRDTAQRQQSLNEETISQIQNGLSSPGPIEFRQTELRDISAELANQFKQSAEQAAPGTTAPGAANSTANPPVSDEAQQAAETARLFAQAGELIDEAVVSQTTAIEGLKESEGLKDGDKQLNAGGLADNPRGESRGDDQSESAPPAAASKIVTPQNQSLQKLLEALSLFDDNDDDSNDDQDDEGEEENEQDQQDANEGKQDGSDQTEPQNTDGQNAEPQRNLSAEQILQAIRDAEAKRRQQKKPQAVGSGIVDKDW